MFTDDGIYWPDEIHQSLEPAHRLVFGYGLIAWEFVEGARNWAFPGFIAGLMSATAGLGGDSPQIYLLVIRFVFVAMSLGDCPGDLPGRPGLGGIRGSRRCRRGGLGPGGALDLLCAPRHERECRDVRGGLGGGLPAGAARPLADPVWLGASLLGLSVLFRIQMGVFVIGVLGVLAARRNWRGLLESLAVLSVWAVAYGAIDALAWSDAPGAAYGGWFHSAILYLRFTLIEGRSAQWGTSPPGYYAEFIFRSMPIIAACPGDRPPGRTSIRPGAVVLALLFLAAHSAIPHKEFRFILPMLPLAVAATVTSFDALPRAPRLAGVGLLLVGAVVSAVTFPSLTWGDLGAHRMWALRTRRRARGTLGDRSTACFSRPTGSGTCVDCGWTLPAFHGASSYLHRPVYIYHDVPESSGLYNYAIAGGIGIAGRGPGSRNGTGQGRRDPLQARSRLRLAPAA